MTTIAVLAAATITGALLGLAAVYVTLTQFDDHTEGF